MLISVHLPKTAGVSFRNAIADYYGNRLLHDYGDYPLNHSALSRNRLALKNCILNAVKGNSDSSIECIHGHFMPLKYLFHSTGSKRRFITWMRDPVERLASQYYYWQRDYDRDTARPLRKRVIEEKWSLERFCLGPELKNVYSKFLWGFPFNRFDFVGITEHYDTELEYFSNSVMDASLKTSQENVNPDKDSVVYVQDESLRNRIELHHKADMMLYRRALSLRGKRLSAQSRV